MNSLEPTCDPDMHCYHEFKTISATSPEQNIMICCTCGDQYIGLRAELHPNHKYYKPQ